MRIERFILQHSVKSLEHKLHEQLVQVGSSFVSRQEFRLHLKAELAELAKLQLSRNAIEAHETAVGDGVKTWAVAHELAREKQANQQAEADVLARVGRKAWNSGWISASELRTLSALQDMIDQRRARLKAVTSRRRSPLFRICVAGALSLIALGACTWYAARRFELWDYVMSVIPNQYQKNQSLAGEWAEIGGRERLVFFDDGRVHDRTNRFFVTLEGTYRTFDDDGLLFEFVEGNTTVQLRFQFEIVNHQLILTEEDGTTHRYALIDSDPL